MRYRAFRSGSAQGRKGDILHLVFSIYSPCDSLTQLVESTWRFPLAWYSRVNMPASWKGYISFGLVSVPISLSPAARSESISFNQLHNVCHSRLKHPLFCPTCNRDVEWSEIEKGYEYEKDQYLLFTPQELKSVEPATAEAMEILEFVK